MQTTTNEFMERPDVSLDWQPIERTLPALTRYVSVRRWRSSR
jgi:hypothetical protein